jgi:hypothetical protein
MMEELAFGRSYIIRNNVSCHSEPFDFAQDKLREESPPQAAGFSPALRAGASVTPFGRSHRPDVLRENDIAFLMLGTPLKQESKVLFCRNGMIENPTAII